MTKRLIILFIIVLSISINGFSQKSIYAPTLIDPANKAENISTFITLRWAPVAGAFYYKVQIDTAKLTDKTPAYSTIITPADSIRYLLFGTKYYWRVKSYSEDKKDSSKWSDVFSFTVIYKPELTTPADTATNIKIPLNLTWKTISGTQNYDYQIDLTPKFNTSFKYESSVNGKNNTVSLSSNILEYGKKYYWRVRARHNKSTSDWSNAFSFTTINNITDAPKASSPENNSNGIATTVTFKWHPVANAIKYIFQYSLSNNFNSILSSDTITVNSIEKKELLFNNKYYWRIKASNLNNISNWSNIFNFTIIDKPVLLAPDNNLTNSNTDKVTLKWNAINGVNNYICETDINNSFNSDKFKTYLVSNTELKLPKLDNETQYFWRVKAIHSKDSSNYSDIFNFTTLSLKLSSPLLINPKNQSVAEPLSITFNWSKINTANSYRFVLSLNENFDSSLIDSTLSANSIMIENLLYNTLYYWRVKSNNDKDTSDWSVVYNFNTFDKFPALTNIIYPLNNANNINPSLEINWTKIDSATTYILQTDVNPDFSNPLSDTLSTLTKDTSNLNFGSSYYLRIKTSKDTVYSEWSDTVVFTTIVKPILISPAMNLNNVNVTNISLKWASIKGISAYELQLDNNNQFNSKNLLYVKDIKDSSSVVNNLFYTTTYFWRVRALNAQDTSDWSDIYSFNTIKNVNLLYPANLSQNLSTDLTLEWEALNLADEYYIQVDTSAAFNTSFLKLDSSYGQTQIKITKLMYGKKYYWRVKAKNSFSQSAWSATYNFTTINKLELYYPANNIANTILIPKLMWENASGISNYELEMDTT
ncbi:MAG: hypothetical protein KA792_06045, partial [Bacteroidales bacterium]|nr:hypothetical protein [Bacteroidales bacterium]